MAIIFELWAECHDPLSAQALVAHFADQHETLLTGRTIVWQAGLEPSAADQHAVTVWSPDLSRFGVRTIQDVVETTEAGLRLYHRLLLAPDFRFARADWQAGNIPLADLPEWVDVWAGGERHLDLDCVMDDALYQELGAPRYYTQFRPGYWWHPYRGERYRPLHSSDQHDLNRLCLELFPSYFTR
jgi:hypothetical protein